MAILRAFTEPDHFDVTNLQAQFYSSPASPAAAARDGVRGAFGNSTNAYNERGVWSKCAVDGMDTESNFWVHYGLYFEGTAKGRYIAFTTATETMRLAFVLGNVSNGAVLSTDLSPSGQPTQHIKDSQGLVSNILNMIDINFIHIGPDGTYRINLYINNNLVDVYDVDTVNPLVNIYVGVPSTATTTGATGLSRISEIIVADEDTRQMRIWTRYPIANGSEQQWIGSYTDINEPVDSHSTYVQSLASGQRSTFVLNDIAATQQVISVGRFVYCTAARSATSGVNAVQWGIRSAAGAETVSPMTQQDTTFQNNVFSMPGGFNLSDTIQAVIISGSV